MSDHKTLIKNGMWANNPALVQLLGLCPLLAVSSTVTNALGLGIATLLVLVGSNVAVSLVRNHVPKEVRIPVFVMIIASLVTCVQLLMNAYAYGLYLSLGIFILCSASDECLRVWPLQLVTISGINIPKDR